MIRILQVVNDMHRAGLETMLMNYYRHIDRSKIQFDFLTHRPYKSDYDDEIESLGGHVYHAPRLYPHNYPKYFKWMKEFFKDHPEYKIIHSHIDSMSYIPLLAAKKAGIPIRIAHSHNTSIDKDLKYLLKLFFKFKINSVCTDRLACGQEAGFFLFGKKSFRVIPNAIDSKKFIYNEKCRRIKRQELGINNQFVIGHIGRISYQKNHIFLIKVFYEFHKLNKNSILILVGIGEKENKIRKMVKKYKLTDSVMFLGNRSDVNELYQAFDAFVLPSHFEGIPVVGIEAQYSGLQCFFSNTISQEIAFTQNTFFISLKMQPKYWAKLILSKKQTLRTDNVVNKIYDIKQAKYQLENLYNDLFLGD